MLTSERRNVAAAISLLLAAAASPALARPPAPAAGTDAPQQASPDPPEWFQNPAAHTDAAHLVATAAGASSRMQLAVDKAQMAARSDLAEQLGTRYEVLRKRIQEEVGSGADSEIMERYNSMTRSVTDQVLQGTNARKQDVHPADSATYRAYVLMELPLRKADRRLLKEVMSEEEMYVRFRATRAFQDLRQGVRGEGPPPESLAGESGASAEDRPSSEKRAQEMVARSRTEETERAGGEPGRSSRSPRPLLRACGTKARPGIAAGRLTDLPEAGVLTPSVGGMTEMWLGSGSGKLELPGGGPGSEAGRPAALGDLNGDNRLDAVVAPADGPHEVWLSAGGGRLEPAGETIGRGGAGSVALMDLNGDNRLDALLQPPGRPAEVYLNSGDGQFERSGATVGSDRTAGVALGDLNGDNRLDVVVGRADRPPRPCVLTGGDRLSLIVSRARGPYEVWLNSGSGEFEPTGQTLGGLDSDGFTLGDLNGDNRLDFLVKHADGAAAAWVNAGDGTFERAGR